MRSGERPHLRAGTRRPLRPRRQGIPPRTLSLGSGPFLSGPTAGAEVAPPQVAGRGLPQQTCHPTPRKRAAPSRLLFVPPPGSALGRRLLPRPRPHRAAEGRGTALGPTRGCLGFRPSGPLRTTALFALFLPCGRRAELGGGGAPNSEPAQVSVGAGPGGASSGRGRDDGGGRPGANRARIRVRAAGRPAFGDDETVPPPGSPSPSVGGAHAAQWSRSPVETAAAPRWPGRGRPRGLVRLVLGECVPAPAKAPPCGTSGLAPALSRPRALRLEAKGCEAGDAQGGESG